MIIKLQADQVSFFWDPIFLGIVESNKIPKEFHQDYAIHVLTKIQTGSYQVWACYEGVNGSKRIKAFLITSILDEKYHGVKVLNAEGIYGFRELNDSDINDIIAGVTEFGKSNGCRVISADYSIPRVKEILSKMGFEEHRTICRKFI